jgi:hypothetical protein
VIEIAEKQQRAAVEAKRFLAAVVGLPCSEPVLARDERGVAFADAAAPPRRCQSLQRQQLPTTNGSVTSNRTAPQLHPPLGGKALISRRAFLSAVPGVASTLRCAAALDAGISRFLERSERLGRAETTRPLGTESGRRGLRCPGHPTRRIAGACRRWVEPPVAPASVEQASLAQLVASTGSKVGAEPPAGAAQRGDRRPAGR